MHWQGKFRGPDFAPIHFTLRTVTHERLKDSKGRLVPTVVASPLSEQGRDDMVQAAQSHEDEMLVALLDPANRKASQRELARAAWLADEGRQAVSGPGQAHPEGAEKGQADHHRTGPDRPHQKGPGGGENSLCSNGGAWNRNCFRPKHIEHGKPYSEKTPSDQDDDALKHVSPACFKMFQKGGRRW